MPNRTDHPDQQPSPADMARQPNQILAEPATVDACQQDYDTAADVRQTLAQQEARRR